MDSSTSGLVFLASIRKQSEQITRSQSGSSTPLRLLHQLLPLGSWSTWALCFLQWCGHINQINRFFPSCFGHGVLSQRSTLSHICHSNIPWPSTNFYLSYDFHSVAKHHGQKQFGKLSVYSSWQFSGPSSKEVRAGTWSRDYGGVLLQGL